MKGNPREAIIAVIADDRERHGGVVKSLRSSLCFDVAVRRLAVADYQLVDNSKQNKMTYTLIDPPITPYSTPDEIQCG